MSTSHPIFSVLPTQTQEKLRRLASDVAGVQPTEVKAWKIEVSNLPSEPDGLAIVEQLANWAGRSKACIYYFANLAENVKLEVVENTFANAKAHEENDRAYPRLNTQGHNFYVGSSQSIAKRFKEHLGYGSSRTYALQLIHWARDLGLELEFVCAKYPDNTPPSVMQALEDTLWLELKPMFGRMGTK